MTYTPVAPFRVSTFDLDQLNQQFADALPQEILGWCVQHLSARLVQTSAFNVDDMVITDLLYRELRPSKPVPVLFLDTLHHFPQTLELVAKAQKRYDLDLRVYQVPEVTSRAAFAARYGEALWDTDIQQFHHLTKVEPLQRGLADLGAVAWITGRRRDQAVTRGEMPIFELDTHQRLKVNPLAAWTRKQSWIYVFEHSVIYNPLHDQGYASIGDEPITTAVEDGEDERAGRWRGTGKTECGIHL
ncbi:phosphoadenosine phosphosulfate reductase [Neosynechococcus sphagnicola sy1]|uniref:Phosphoadenosine 5'-phosphosulfate reductase n=1 Tax=Neosynechococcus sphagnicola sy1 TaxID=1497020 RepID=A0A098TNJ5_9CYAN|nr:phosphoadenosine phosphosulfate reductase [Neosynechococcus sphagnicola]KGF73864.1 phosphoadenosine phosphosulfate reductase [Neosynechococcus sphagnicola sy1]